MADVGLAMQRALDKTENMKARADAVQELEAAGTFEDLTTLTPGEDDIDRQLRQLSSSSEVDQELARMKAELGQGSAPAGELGAGTPGGAGAGAGGAGAGAAGGAGAGGAAATQPGPAEGQAP
jgi:phage shock protein A